MADKNVKYLGWFHPHAPVNWTGEKLDPKTGELVKEFSMTKQSFVHECNINNIIKQYQVTGIYSHINERAAQGVYTDLPDPLDYQQSLNVVMAAEASFSSLPSTVRSRFQNDPEQFLEFVSNPANQEELIKLGLAKDKRPPKPAPVDPPAPPLPLDGTQ